MIISAFGARPIITSRGTWTIETTVQLADGSVGVAAVPEGKSAGSHEMKNVPVETALQHLNQTFQHDLLEFDGADQTMFDTRLLEIDGTTDRSQLGANVMLSLSLANCKAQAQSNGLPLWLYLANISGAQPAPPQLLANLINGGVHAGSGLPFQEYLVIPNTNDSNQASALLVQFYEQLGELLEQRFGKNATLLGDEGGYAPQLTDALEPLALFEEVRESFGLAKGEILYGIDVAANELTNPTDLAELYQSALQTYPLMYLEDPYPEDDLDSCAALLKTLPKETHLVGDDLTTTNLERIDLVNQAKAANGIIIKPNQIGTLTETLQAVSKARALGWSVTVSHRSGETTDAFIADLAVGVAADGFKLGAPARGERTAKYNRLLAIQLEMVQLSEPENTSTL